MFGCSDVYHWMGRTAKAVCLPDCGRKARKVDVRAAGGTRSRQARLREAERKQTADERPKGCVAAK
jgi:hypothetical protein